MVNAQKTLKRSNKNSGKHDWLLCNWHIPEANKLIEATRAYERGAITKKLLEKAFKEATTEIVGFQESVGFSYITDGMLKWQDLLRPFTENLNGVKTGSLARWFNNNMFYRTSLIARAQRLRSFSEICL
jgi:methionine synthase II (cobalamin-independent)